MKIKQTINFAHSLQSSENYLDLCGPPSHPEATAPTLTSASVQSATLAKTKRKYQKKFLASQTGHKPNCFSPSVEYHQNTEEIDFPINCNDRLLEKKKEKEIVQSIVNKFMIAMNDNYQKVGNCTIILT